MEYKGVYYEKEQKANSILEGDELFNNRILSRDSSVGQSSRIFYGGNAEGIPFKWEMQPGKPKYPQASDPVPPLCPPPAMQSLGLPLPRQPLTHDDDDEVAAPNKSRYSITLSKLLVWKKKIKKKLKVDGGDKKVVLQENKERSRVVDNVSSKSDKFEWFEIGEPEDDHGSEAARDSNYSSLSSSSSNGHSRMTRFPHGNLIHGPFSCSPWNINGITVFLAKKVR